MHGQKKPPRDWVGSQLWYFVNNGEERETKVHFGDAASWCLFVVSGVLAAVLCAWVTFPQAVPAFARKANSLLSFASLAGFDLVPCCGSGWRCSRSLSGFGTVMCGAAGARSS